ncbi:carbohydrate ABC transporter permease [Flaviflexus huanghaiensis]|uniref:carbohydrate ABC transporter permease n=1 Tax=Flaviflexus huanghaiensis TaxID=1111473 RepID=UPI0015F9BDA2|nr:sugar ABC transporter permease [Flaviflexus huanghaiensis]
MLKIFDGLVAVVGSVGFFIIVFWLLNAVAELLPTNWERRVKPWVFVGPALAFILVFLIYPAIRTLILSVFDRRGEEFVGLENFTGLLTDSAFQSTMVNTLLWILVVPILAVALGLLVATLTDRLPASEEKVSKSLIFLPMAISMVGASTIWRFVYEWRPEGQPQIGLLNQFWTAVGGQPQVWMQISSGKLNSFLLMVILIWLQVGFAMVLLSAAIKNVPSDTVEAARVDGAGEIQIFFRIVLPQIKVTMLTVFITILIGVLKVFDIAYVMTGGNYDTNVVALAFFKELFTYRHDGRAAAIVVLLMLAIIPVIIYQIRSFKAEEAAR